MRTSKSEVYTNPAKCSDCYRCVRVCPVNAIKMENGQAMVIPENCIACGTCIPECPQHAKTYVNHVADVIDLLAANNPVIISIAPSFATVYSKWERKRLPSALRQAGFFKITETAIGAYEVAQKTREYIENKPNSSHICTACPAVVNYIQKYCKEEIPDLVPVVSPMIAHARMLKTELGPDCRVVFAGPCVAKKDEALHPKNKAFVDAVLTFSELDEILLKKNIDLKACEESSFDQKASGFSKLFPLEEGLLKTAGFERDTFNKVIALSGFDEVKDALAAIQQKKGNYVIEPLFCRSGCINGPVVRNSNLLQKRSELLDYFNETPKLDSTCQNIDNLGFKYEEKATSINELYSENEISEVLKSTGKLNEEDELNCMACGYATCRDKAIAVLQGIAEIEMCMPYMRRLAEQKNDKLIAADPNGLVILNQKLELVSMNPAFKKMFICSDNLLGKGISYLIDPEPFERIATKQLNKYNEVIKYQAYNLVCHLLCYAIEEENQFVGIFVDITDTYSNKEKLKDLKTETITQAQELMEHQINMAQELARFIGDHTARGEILMNKLINEIRK
ncbi:MAG: [Fe-Fe] hydrogenase large subunit C-terminal domain-containing protein [Bacteroidales bacterium]|nr:[Fe-Fe] hydrogenase large subunit C-terminal domain-containing protein [Bacteroidales bacterium]